MNVPKQFRVTHSHNGRVTFELVLQVTERNLTNAMRLCISIRINHRKSTHKLHNTKGNTQCASYLFIKIRVI